MSLSHCISLSNMIHLHLNKWDIRAFSFGALLHIGREYKKPNQPPPHNYVEVTVKLTISQQASNFPLSNSLVIILAPPKDFTFKGPQTFECINSSNSDFLEEGCFLKETLICLPTMQWEHFSKFAFFNPGSISFLAKQFIPFSLIWLSLWCHRNVSISIAFTLSLATKAFIQYNFEIFFPLATTRLPLVSFHFSEPKWLS